MTVENKEGATIRASVGTLGFLVAIFFFNMLSRLGFAPLMPDIEHDLGLAHAEAGSLFMSYAIGYSLGMFCSPFISARLSHRRSIVYSSLTVGVSLLILSFINQPWLFRLGLTAMGFGGGVYLPSGVATLTSAVRKRDWGKALSIHQLAPNLAYICSPLFANLLLQWFHWRTILVYYGCAALALGFAFLRPGEHRPVPAERPSWSSMGKLFSDRSIWIMIVLFSLSIGVNQGLFGMMPLYLISQRGLEPALANHLISISRIASFALPLASGWACDRFGLKKSLYVTVLASGLAIILVALIPNRLIIVGLFFQAMTSVCFFPLGFSAVSTIASPDRRNLAVAVTVPFGYVFGIGVFPILIGAAGDYGNFNLGLYFLGGLTLLGAPLLRKLKIK